MANSLVKRLGQALTLAAGLAGVSGCGMAMGTVAGFQRTPNDAFMISAIGNSADDTGRRDNEQRRHKMINGSYWTGNLNEEGCPHGYGIMENPNFVYEGWYKDGVGCGYGKAKFSNGKVYEGYWFKGNFMGNDKREFERIMQNGGSNN